MDDNEEEVEETVVEAADTGAGEREEVVEAEEGEHNTVDMEGDTSPGC